MSRQLLRLWGSKGQKAPGSKVGWFLQTALHWAVTLRPTVAKLDMSTKLAMRDSRRSSMNRMQALPRYALDSLGSTEFEQMIQALLKSEIGPGTTSFGSGRDGAREATFLGKAPYPSTSNQWQGNWIFQVKFHDVSLVSPMRARNALIADLRDELTKIVHKYKYECDNYILITNVNLTGVHRSGTIDRIENEVFSEYRKYIPNLHIWGGADVCRLLDKNPEIRRSYLHLLVSGDLIAELMDAQTRELNERALTMQSYIHNCLIKDRNAQLDQAGDHADKPIPLRKVFFELDSKARDFPPGASTGAAQALPRAVGLSAGSELPTLSFLLSERASRVVLIGGPGEGKSTVGQYLAQTHRAALLPDAEGHYVDDQYTPTVPRLPFRIVLKDFGQWLALRLDSGETKADTLDAYICEQVFSIGAREISVADLHSVIRHNPSLLIFDGLDEITDRRLRTHLIERIGEFIDRCESVLRADLQILATTRPNGYTNQFNPEKFAHLELVPLSLAKVRHYVGRWCEAKDLDAEKELRVKETMDDCLQDPQVRLLAETPLQVTILLLIVLSGGTPPRQREALFNDYLEVMYKREKAKSRNMIKTEKELLFGLHRYIGYILHEESARGRSLSARLERREYQRAVGRFLKHNNPYASVERRKADLDSIEKEAGERLVLLVESPADQYGFELRSIQEFFAASHLVDTAQNTVQRYQRFREISRLPHWRNVALFFAGRVGRNHPGEAANVLEECKSIDRSEPDVYTRRGCILALELAADRAFDPNERLQRSLIEYGLSILVSPWHRQPLLQTRSHGKNGRGIGVVDILHRFSLQDIQDHLIPVLREKLAESDDHAKIRIVKVLRNFELHNPGLDLVLDRFSKSEDETERMTALEEALSRSEESLPWAASVIRSVLSSNLSKASVEKAVLPAISRDPIWTARCLAESGYDVEKLASTWDWMIAGSSNPEIFKDNRLTAQSNSLEALFWVNSVVMSFLLDRASSPGHSVGQIRPSRTRQILESLGSLKESVVSGTNEWVTDHPPRMVRRVERALWVAHFGLGSVTTDSVRRFTEYLADDHNRELMDGWIGENEVRWPISMRALIYAVGVNDRDVLRSAASFAEKYGGAEGEAAWIKQISVFSIGLRESLGVDSASVVLEFGAKALGGAEMETASRLYQEMTGLNFELPAVWVDVVPPRSYGRARPYDYVNLFKKVEEWIGEANGEANIVALCSHRLPQGYELAVEVNRALTILLEARISGRVSSVGPLIALMFASFELGYPDSALVGRCLSFVNNSCVSEIPWLSFPDLKAQRRFLVEMVSAVKCDDVEVRRGAAVMLAHHAQFFFSLGLYEIRRKPSSPGRGMAEARRTLLRSDDYDQMTAGLALLAAWKIAVPKDLESIEIALRRTPNEASWGAAWDVALTAAVSQSDVREALDWIDLLCGALRSGVSPSIMPIVLARLQDFENELNASLAAMEVELGLPLREDY